MPAPYRGWMSTKLHLALIAMWLMTCAYCLTAFNPALFGEYCTGIVTAAALYSGSSVVEKIKAKLPSKVDAPE